MRRIVLFWMAVLGFAAMLPVQATEIPEKDWEYERIDDDHVAIHNADQSRRKAAIDTATAGDIVVPSTLRSMQVVSIGESAFYECSKLTSVVIPEGVTNIAANAFYNCSSLTNVVIPSSMKSIDTDVFRNCVKLQTVKFTCSSLTVGDHAFIECTGLETFSVAGDSISIGEAAFSGCTELRKVDISGKIVNVGKGAFTSYNVLPYYCKNACTALTNAVLVGTSSATIGESAFSDCTALQSVDLPIALKDIATNAFYTCKNLERVSLSTNVTHISYRAFDSCSALKSVDMVEGLSSIDAQAFYGCSSITNLTFPQSLSTIGNRAFEKCSGITQMVFAEGNTNLVSAEELKIGERAFYQCSSITNVTLPQKLTSMGERAFSQCDALSRINLPTGLTEIAVSLFEDCSALPMIGLPNKLTAIGNNAFFNCTNLTNFLIPTNNTVTLGSKAFNNTKYWNDYPDDLVVNNGYILGFKGNPTSVTLPDTCKAIPVGMFEGMTTLKSVVIPDSVTEIGARAFNGCTALTNLAFNSVTTIGNSAFEGCSSLAGVKISEALESIPGNCFKNCTTLLTINIPSKVASIGEYAFYNCSSLATVTGATGVTAVGDYAFADCLALKPFEFANDVAYGDHVFKNCTWTEHVLFPNVGTLKDEYPSTYANIKSVVFSSSMTNLANSACAGCTSLEYVHIPNGVVTIGELAFDNCSSLTSVVMSASVSSVASNSFTGCESIASLVVSGKFALSTAFPDAYDTIAEVGLADGITSLGDGVFAGCASLKSVDIPWTVTEIGERAFWGCSKLAEIVIPEYVDTISSEAFGNCEELKHVDYLCEQPSASEDVYSGTRTSMFSKVLPRLASWQSTTNSAGAAILPSAWPDGDNGRPVVWWGSASSLIAQVRFSYADNTGAGTNVYFLANAGRQLLDTKFPEDPERDGYTFAGWWTAQYGGTQIEAGVDVGDSVTYYAHWTKDDEEELPTEYDFSRANTYNGYLMNGDAIAGSVQIKFAKGKWDKSEEETNSVATASVQLLGEGKLTLKGTLHDGGSGELEHAKSERTLDVSIDDFNSLTGSFDGYDVVAYRDLFSSSFYDDRTRARAMVDDVKGSYVVVLAADGGTSFTSGYAALSVSVGTSGKVKVSGTMPDGVKVSATSQLLIRREDEMSEDVGYVAAVVPMYSKKGGFGFLLTFGASEDDLRTVSLTGVSTWIADKEGTEVGLSDVGVQSASGLPSGEYLFMADLSGLTIEGVDIADELSPDGTEISASARRWTLPRADTVKFDREEQGYVITKDNGNPAALKLSYAGSTGLFKGTFKVYGITEEGKSKKYTANVNGGVVGGIGYGSAVIKKIGSMPIGVQ